MTPTINIVYPMTQTTNNLRPQGMIKKGKWHMLNMIKDRCLFPLATAQSFLPRSHGDSHADGILISVPLKNKNATTLKKQHTKQYLMIIKVV
jgi:hypothetical protein